MGFKKVEVTIINNMKISYIKSLFQVWIVQIKQRLMLMKLHLKGWRLPHGLVKALCGVWMIVFYSLALVLV